MIIHRSESGFMICRLFSSDNYITFLTRQNCLFICHFYSPSYFIALYNKKAFHPIKGRKAYFAVPPLFARLNLHNLHTLTGVTGFFYFISKKLFKGDFPTSYFRKLAPCVFLAKK